METSQFKGTIDTIVDALDDDGKKHLQFLVNKLILCYAKGGPNSAVVIFNSDDGHIALASANANMFECAEMVQKAYEYTQESMLKDAPAKEMFN
jgi:hypothetical protein